MWSQPGPPCDPVSPPTPSSGHAARAPSSGCPVLHCGHCQALALCQVPTLCTPCWALTQASPRGCHLSDTSKACGLFPVPTNRRRVLNGLARHQPASWCAGDGMGPQSAQYTRLPPAPPSFPRFPRLLQVPLKPPPRFPRLPQVPPGSPVTPRFPRLQPWALCTWLLFPFSPLSPPGAWHRAQPRPEHTDAEGALERGACTPHPCSEERETDPTPPAPTGRRTEAHSKCELLSSVQPLSPRSCAKLLHPRPAPPGPSTTNQKWSWAKLCPQLWT